MYLSQNVRQRSTIEAGLRSSVPQQSPQNFPPLPEARFRPLDLRLTRLCNRSVDAVCSGWVHKAEKPAIGRTVALNGA